MKTKPGISGASLALAAAACFTYAPLPAIGAGETVRCHGVNECRSRGACATANNQCAGQNACRGQGVLDISREACESKNGRIEE